MEKKYLPISVLVPPGEELPGDIYSARENTIQSFLIRFCTGSDISHVGGIISGWEDGYIHTVDAVIPKTKINKQEQIHGQVWRIWKTPEEQELLVNLMKAEVGKYYDVFSVFRIFLYGIITTTTFNMWKPNLPVFSNKKFRFCSEETLEWVQAFGFDHPKYTPKELHPGEFARFMNWYFIRRKI